MQRYYADDKTPPTSYPKPAAVPASETTTAAASSPPPAPQTTTSSSIPANKIPLTPPPPPTASTPASTANSSPPPPPPSPPKKKKSFIRRLRNYIVTLTLLGGLLFGGGVWYSRVNDNFHDFFTEYIPFGEQAVLYLEEMDFRKRFPHVANRVSTVPPTRSRDADALGGAVKIPAQSGMSPRIAAREPAKEEVGKIQAHKNDLDADASAQEKKGKEAASAKDGVQKAGEPTGKKAPEQPEKPVGGPVPVSGEQQSTPPPAKSSEKAQAKTADSAPAIKTSKDTSASSAAFKPPEVDEPSKWPPASPIDPISVDGAKEPIVQDLVKMLNDIITVVNADGANEKYAATIGKAKSELSKVGRKIKDIKTQTEKDAASQVRARVDDFDKAANDLIARVESAMASQEKQWREEFEEEMGKLKETYDARVKVATERERQIGEEKASNKLLDQAVQLKRQFASDIQSQVEAERDGRLGKLNDLSSAVSELEKLTTGWNSVIDASSQTQQLHVAIDALRARLEDPENRRFVSQLAAIKEIANSDPVVSAAIGSINPTAYNRGVSTTSQLIDRFRRVATEVRKAALLPDNAGVASHATSWVLSHLLFKKEGLTDGDDVESILTRTQTYLEEGDLDNAAREMNGLTGWAKTLSRDWLGEVRKVLEVQQAVDVSNVPVPEMLVEEIF
jgi:MICOS complex subunit MIC60